MVPTYNDFNNKTHTRPMLSIAVLAGALFLAPQLALADTVVELTGDAQVSSAVEGATVREASAVSAAVSAAL